MPIARISGNNILIPTSNPSARNELILVPASASTMAKKIADETNAMKRRKNKFPE
jgi:hypothetical protein